MNITLKSEVIDKLSARGILAYVAVQMNRGKWASPAKLAGIIRVPENVMVDGLKNLEAVQSLDQPKPKPAAMKMEEKFVLPDWITPKVWDEFIRMRVRKGSPLTEYAKGITVAKLAKLVKDSGENPDEILQQSIERTWLSVFPLKKDDSGNGFHAQAAPKLKATEFKL